MRLILLTRPLLHLVINIKFKLIIFIVKFRLIPNNHPISPHPYLLDNNPSLFTGSDIRDKRTNISYSLILIPGRVMKPHSHYHHRTAFDSTPYFTHSTVGFERKRPP